MESICICGLAGLAAGLFFATGLTLIVLSSKCEGRKGEIALLALGGVLLLACVCASIGMIWSATRIYTPSPPAPTSPPTQQPTHQPTEQPTRSPTPTPTVSPTPRPTQPPTASPTLHATVPPSRSYPMDLAPYVASLLPGERASVDILDDPPIYTLDVRVDWHKHTIAGVETLLVTNNEGLPLDRLYLRLYPNAPYYEEGRTAVGTVKLGSQPVESRVDGTVLEIALPQPLAPEGRVSLSIPFTVTVPRRPDRFGYEDDVMMLGHWYPLLAVYDDEGWNLDPYVAIGDAFYSESGFYTVHLTVPKRTVVASTGVEVARAERGDEMRITLVSAATRDFTLALSPDYRTLTRQVGGTRVTSFYLPGDEEGARDALDTAAQAIEVFNVRFGPYPYPEFDVAETPFLIEGSPGGMEYPGLIFISSDLYDQRTYYSPLTIIVAHETAHQWWYSIVGNNQVDEPWLDEAFATFAEILYVEETQGKAAAQETEALWVEFPYMMATMMGEDRPVATSLLEFGDDSLLYSAIVYSKGALFLRELRGLVGDEAFFAILQHHYATYRYGIVPPDGFRRSIAEVTGDDPDALALYDLWVLSEETPSGFGIPGLEIPEENLENDWEMFRRLEELLEQMEEGGQ